LEYLTREQLSATLRKKSVSIRIGDFLVELGHLKKSDLVAALNLQLHETEHRMLGDIFVENGFIEERKLIEVLSFQLGLPVAELEFRKLNRKLLSKAPFQLYREAQFVPLCLEGSVATVAFANPLDQNSRQTAEKLFGSDLKPVIASKKSLNSAIAAAENSAGQASEAVADEGTVVGIINKLFDDAMTLGASDIHVEPLRDRLRIRLRLDGVMMLHQEFPVDIAPQLSSRIKVMAQADIAEKRRHQDGRILYESRLHGFNLDLRVSFFVTIFGEKIVLRLLNKKQAIPEIGQVGMAPRMLDQFVRDVLDAPSGVVIITGPTGSGKTSTLYGCLGYLNNIDTCIVTAEDPVEFVIEGIAQCSMNAKIGVTFEETLRHIVRQDPDIIVLGEMRDTFSAETAIEASLTGHKVLTTFHTEDSVGGLLRLMNMNIEAFLIASTVVCVLSQRLLRRICPECTEPYLPTPTELRRIGYSNVDLRGAEFSIGRGCSKCRYSGYRGRVGVFEMLILNELVKDAILSKKTSYEIRKISTETTGMVTLLESGLCKAASGLVSLQDTVRLLPRIGKPRSITEIRRLLGE